MRNLFKLTIAAAVAAAALFTFAGGLNALPERIDDPWLELSFSPPPAWKLVAPENFTFSLVETDPAYIFQKGNSTIFLMFQNAEGLGLEEASEWMHESAGTTGKVYELLYKDVNGRAVSEFMVSGRGDQVGSVPALAKKQVDNVIATFINGEWLIRVVFSSPDYRGAIDTYDAFIDSFRFKGAPSADDKSIERDGGRRLDSAPPRQDPYQPGLVPNEDRACTSRAVLKIRSPQDGSATKNSETSLKVDINDIDEVRIKINGQEVALLSGAENPIYRKIMLENGENRIAVVGRDICGVELRDAVIITREAKN